MKKILVCSIFAVLLMSCSSKNAKDYGCTKYSFECESQKDRMLLLPIKIDSTLVDAYGDSIITETTQWYMVHKKVGVLIPVQFPIAIGQKIDHIIWDNNPTLSVIMEHRTDVHIDTVLSNSKLPKGVSSAYVLTTGAGEFEAFSIPIQAQVIAPVEVKN